MKRREAIKAAAGVVGAATMVGFTPRRLPVAAVSGVIPLPARNLSPAEVEELLQKYFDYYFNAHIDQITDEIRRDALYGVGAIEIPWRK